MTDLNLFPVANREFASGAEFRGYLADEVDPAGVDNKKITLMVGLTKEKPSDIEQALRSFGFEVIRRLGAVLHLRYEGEEDEPLETYYSYEEGTGIILFYSNYRKTQEIPTLTRFLTKTGHAYPLLLRPHIMQQSLDELVSHYPNTLVTDFTAKSSPSTKAPARIRLAKGTFSYWGIDGRETLIDLQSLYGVFLSRLVMEVPGVIKIGVDRRGSFTIFSGQFALLLTILGRAVDESRRAMKAFDGSAFEVIAVRTAEKSFGIPTSTPVQITLTRRLAFSDADLIRTKLDERGYTILNFSAQEGSLFLSSDVVSQSGHPFRIKADEERIKMLPGGTPSFPAFMEFYDFILDELDPEAELAA